MCILLSFIATATTTEGHQHPGNQSIDIVSFLFQLGSSLSLLFCPALFPQLATNNHTDFPDRLLHPIRTHGFATLNTTLYYREHTWLTVALFCLRVVGVFWPSGIIFGGSPGLYYR